MSKFFNDTMQGLLETIAIKNGEIKMEEVPDMPAKTLRVANLVKFSTTRKYPKSSVLFFSMKSIIF